MMADLTQLADDLWVVQRPLSFFGLQLGARMTVVRFGEDLLLHSPVAPDDALLGALEELGRVRWVVGPNTFHHLALGAWQERGAEVWGVKALAQKRSDLDFAGVVGSKVPWGDALELHQTSCIPFTDEAVFFHRPSKTLIVTDLLFNLTESTPILTRWAMRAGGGYPGVCCTLLEKLLIKRGLAREDVARMLAWPIDTIVLAHGEVVTTEAHDALRHAYAWLGELPERRPALS